jgi:hypothetical protein
VLIDKLINFKERYLERQLVNRCCTPHYNGLVALNINLRFSISIMNAFLGYVAILLLLTSGCKSRRKREEFERRRLELNQKEQALLFKEKTLQLKEEELRKREEEVDSSRMLDSVNVYNSVLIGTWSVKMTCTETTCMGFAVGDTKNEVWDISYQQNSILAKAMEGNSLVRVYSGRFTGSAVELTEITDSTRSLVATKTFVRLNIINENTMEGQREIFRENECRVTYELELRKQSQA